MPPERRQAGLAGRRVFRRCMAARGKGGQYRLLECPSGGGGERQAFSDGLRLDDLPLVHHDHSVAEAFNQAQIMGDEQIAGVPLLLDPFE